MIRTLVRFVIRFALAIVVLAFPVCASPRAAAALLGLHGALCFMRAYPDDRAGLAQAARRLARFERRADLRRHRARLADSGIAGTAIHYRFFAETMSWLADRWPESLR